MLCQDVDSVVDWSLGWGFANERWGCGFDNERCGWGCDKDGWGCVIDGERWGRGYVGVGALTTRGWVVF